MTTATIPADKRYHAVVTNAQGWGGYYGYGATPEDAIAQAKSACEAAPDRWSQHRRRVVIDRTTGKEVLRIGKR